MKKNHINTQSMVLQPRVDGEKKVGFGKYRKVLIKNLPNKDFAYAQWLVGSPMVFSPRAIAVGAYLQSAPEFIEEEITQIAAARDVLTPDSRAVLREFELTAAASGKGTLRIGGTTYDFKEILKRVGGIFEAGEW